MDYGQIDIALGFLEPESFIVLQVPHWKDIDLVKKYLYQKMGKPNKMDRAMMEWDQGTVRIQTIQNRRTGYGVREDKLFFIDRDQDRRYYKDLI